MKLGLSILAHQRPDYFAQLVRSLQAVDHRSWDIVVTLDRPDPATMALATSLGGLLHVFYDEPGRGLSEYDRAYRRISTLTRAAIWLPFTRGADFVLHFEEDLILAPDCLAYVAWAATEYQSREDVFTVNAWGMDDGTDPDLYSTRLVPFFTPWGWGTWRDRWTEMDRHWDNVRWDQHLNERVRGDRLGVFPDVARVRNVGVRGTQSADEWFQRENSPRLHFAENADPAHW